MFTFKYLQIYISNLQNIYKFSVEFAENLRGGKVVKKLYFFALD